MPNLYIARQPIYDCALHVIGYELLYRNDEQNRAKFINGDEATTKVVINTFLDIGLENLVGTHQAFINLTRAFLTGNYPIPFPKNQVILEILEDIVIDDEMISACHQLSAAGYTIALDDFVYNEGVKSILDAVRIIKIDVLALGMDETARNVQMLKPFKVKLLAEKVDSYEILEQCQALGFDYFQGYFLAKPNLIKQQRTPVMRLSALRTLSILQNPTTEIKDIEDNITQDITLSYKLLHYTNSAAVAMPKKVDSINQALIIAGTNCIRLWATLIVLANIDDKPPELIKIALLRAKMCALLAEQLKCKDKDTFFTVGLFSTLDALIDKPLAETLPELPLSEAINNALLHYQGKSGEVLHTVLAYESGNGLDQENPLNLPLSTLREAYMQAISWADEHARTLATLSAA